MAWVFPSHYASLLKLIIADISVKTTVQNGLHSSVDYEAKQKQGQETEIKRWTCTGWTVCPKRGTIIPSKTEDQTQPLKLGFWSSALLWPEEYSTKGALRLPQLSHERSWSSSPSRNAEGILQWRERGRKPCGEAQASQHSQPSQWHLQLTTATSMSPSETSRTAQATNRMRSHNKLWLIEATQFWGGCYKTTDN